MRRSSWPAVEARRSAASQRNRLRPGGLILFPLLDGLLLYLLLSPAGLGGEGMEKCDGSRGCLEGDWELFCSAALTRRRAVTEFGLPWASVEEGGEARAEGELPSRVHSSCAAVLRVRFCSRPAVVARERSNGFWRTRCFRAVSWEATLGCALPMFSRAAAAATCSVRGHCRACWPEILPDDGGEGRRRGLLDRCGGGRRTGPDCFLSFVLGSSLLNSRARL